MQHTKFLHGDEILLWLLLILSLLQISLSVKCLDCVGKGCTGSFCEGDYCLLGYYAPRWGTIEWGEPRLVKGCLSGTMLESDIRSHCEATHEKGSEFFTCFCDKDYCNNDKAIRRIEVTPIEMITCVCNGAHCKDTTCVGELCSYVVNHRTKQSEQGCVNASVPLIERRSIGACMIPPITGAMHHSIAKDPHALLATESCICGTEYCNTEKPEVSIPERMKCQTFVSLEAMGNKVVSRNTTCTGEFCFKAKIKSEIGHMSEYKTMGCASFLDGAELAEELQPVGCAKFESKGVKVETCFQTNDKRAIGRARANQEAIEPRRTSPPKSKGKNVARTQKPTMEVEFEEDDESEPNEKEENDKEDENEEESDIDSKKEKEGEEEEEELEEEEKEIKGEKEIKKEEEESKSRKGTQKSHKSSTKGDTGVKTSTALFIFEKPTEPPIPDDSDVTLVTVFILLIIIILMTGAVWKFKLHQRLFRSSYDTVAGG